MIHNFRDFLRVISIAYKRSPLGLTPKDFASIRSLARTSPLFFEQVQRYISRFPQRYETLSALAMDRERATLKRPSNLIDSDQDPLLSRLRLRTQFWIRDQGFAPSTCFEDFSLHYRRRQADLCTWVEESLLDPEEKVILQAYIPFFFNEYRDCSMGSENLFQAMAWTEQVLEGKSDDGADKRFLIIRGLLEAAKVYEGQSRKYYISLDYSCMSGLNERILDLMTRIRGALEPLDLLEEPSFQKNYVTQSFDFFVTLDSTGPKPTDLFYALYLHSKYPEGFQAVAQPPMQRGRDLQDFSERRQIIETYPSVTESSVVLEAMSALSMLELDFIESLCLFSGGSEEHLLRAFETQKERGYGVPECFETRDVLCKEIQIVLQGLDKTNDNLMFEDQGHSAGRAQVEKWIIAQIHSMSAENADFIASESQYCRLFEFIIKEEIQKSLLFRAVEQGKMAFVEKTLNKNLDWMQIRESQEKNTCQKSTPKKKIQVRVHNTLLHLAVKSGQKDVAKFLMQVGGSSIWRAQAHEGATALHWAVINENIDITKLLIEFGDATLWNTQDQYGRTALHWAVINENIDITKLLIESGDATLWNTQDQYGRTALHWAVIKENIDITKLLIESGDATLWNTQDQYGRTALHWAVIKENIDIIKLLIESGDATLWNTQDQYGCTALHLTARSGYKDIAIFLIKTSCSRLMYAENKKGETALHWAAFYGHINMVAIFMEAGGDNLIRVKDHQGKMAFHAAAEQGYTNISKLFISSSARVLMNTRNQYGQTVLHWLAERGYKEIAEIWILVIGHEIVKAQDNYGKTALHNAIRQGHVEIANLLISVGGYEIVKAQDNYGKTALHQAVWQGHIEMAKILILVGGYELVNARDHQGKTALHGSIDRDIKNILEPLILLSIEHGYVFDQRPYSLSLLSHYYIYNPTWRNYVSCAYLLAQTGTLFSWKYFDQLSDLRTQHKNLENDILGAIISDNSFDLEKYSPFIVNQVATQKKKILEDCHLETLKKAFPNSKISLESPSLPVRFELSIPRTFLCRNPNANSMSEESGSCDYSEISEQNRSTYLSYNKER